MSRFKGLRLPIRWLTLGEIVSVAAVLLAGLGYWDAHRERSAAEKAHQAEAAARALKSSFLMTGAQAAHGASLRLTPVHADQVVQTQTLWFPKAVRAEKIETIGNPRLEADWIAAGVRKADPKAKQGRLPVAVQTVFIEDGETKTDRALYDLAYSRHPRLLLGDRVDLEGLSLRHHGVKGDPQAAADKAWSGK